MEKATEINTIDILKNIKKIFIEKKCENIQFLNLQKVNSYLSYFAIATARTTAQARFCAREIEKFMKPYRKFYGNLQRTSNLIPTRDNSGWLVLDYGDIIVHIMQPEIREFYNLERLWGDAEFIEVD